MKGTRLFVFIFAICGIALFLFFYLPRRETETPFVDEPLLINESSNVIKLPDPHTDGELSVERAIKERRSVREYSDEPLALSEVAQLLWAAQGITSSKGQKTAPSAGGLYPLEIYVAVGNVIDLAQGVYKYQSDGHVLKKVADGDVRSKLSEAALGQKWVGEGAVAMVFAGVYERTMQKYGERGVRYVHMEVGHAAQNVYLQATSLDLGTVFVGAFKDAEVKKIMSMEEEKQPLGIMPVGKKLD